MGTRASGRRWTSADEYRIVADIDCQATHSDITGGLAAAVVKGIVLNREVAQESVVAGEDNGKVGRLSGAGTIEAHESVVHDTDVVQWPAQVIIDVQRTELGRLVQEDIVSENQIRHGKPWLCFDLSPLGINERDLAGKPIVGHVNYIVFDNDV